MSTIFSFKSIENKHHVYRGKDCMKKFCEFLRQHAMKMKKMKSERNEIIIKRASGIISKCKNLLYLSKKIENKYLIDKKYRCHCHYSGEYRGAVRRICNLKYSVSEKIPIAFHNGSNYYYHFIIKELAEEFKEKILTNT